MTATIGERSWHTLFNEILILVEAQEEKKS